MDSPESPEAEGIYVACDRWSPSPPSQLRWVTIVTGIKIRLSLIGSELLMKYPSIPWEDSGILWHPLLRWVAWPRSASTGCPPCRSAKVQRPHRRPDGRGREDVSGDGVSQQRSCVRYQGPDVKVFTSIWSDLRWYFCIFLWCRIPMLIRGHNPPSEPHVVTPGHRNLVMLTISW